MSKGRHIRAIGSDTADGGTGETVETVELEASQAEEEPTAWDDTFEEPVTAGRRLWPVLLGALAVAAVAAWTGFFAWANRAAMLSGAAPGQWIEWAMQWAVPVLLVAVAWLIAMRSSLREAGRFGDAARLLAQESTALEARLAGVNRELSLAREFLGAQTRELDYLGRSAAERISEHAGRLQTLVVDNGAQVDAIAGVSQTALANMAELRDNLPVIAASARDVSNQIGSAGRGATTQLNELVAGFERLNEFGQASERQVVSLQQRIDGALGDLGSLAQRMDADNAARLETLQAASTSLRADLEERETQVLDAIRQRGEALRAELVAAHDARQLEEAAALAAMRGRIGAFTQEAHEAGAAVRAGERSALEAWEGQVADLRARLETAIDEVGTLDRNALEQARGKLAALSAEAEAVDRGLGERDRAFNERVAARESELEASEAAAFARMAARAEALDKELATRRDAQLAHADALAQRGEALAARLGEIDTQLGAVSERGETAERVLAGSAESFAATVTANADQLSDAEAAVSRLTDASVRLLELIQAAATHSRSELPAAIEGFEERLGSARDSSGAIRAALQDARELSDAVSASLGEMRGAGDAAIGTLDSFGTRLTGTAQEQATTLAALRDQLAAAHSDNRALAESIASELSAAITRLRDSGKALFSDLESSQSAQVAALAGRVGEESAQTIERAIGERTQAALAQLDEATARSAEASKEAIANLRDQLARVHELTSNLENRAARAREQVEEQVDSDFSRRMALITESLNSHSIDIAKALSTEVTDTAWAAYLKGDRGVFTRRAVRLVDGGEAREISTLFEADHEFREHVSRYIHDFEAMLRTMLSTRDGQALGVTLLSSDMGKLYVALAQAIQRLRQ
ncbi:MAG: ATPase [Altererythrobacter sp.]|nr:ATPase [Altererythrobacter sp.]